MSDEMVIRLTREEFETLLLALGSAQGYAIKEGDRFLFRTFLKLANAINRDNPRWTPYELPEDEASTVVRVLA